MREGLMEQWTNGWTHPLVKSLARRVQPCIRCFDYGHSSSFPVTTSWVKDAAGGAEGRDGADPADGMVRCPKKSGVKRISTLVWEYMWLGEGNAGVRSAMLWV